MIIMFKVFILHWRKMIRIKVFNVKGLIGCLGMGNGTNVHEGGIAMVSEAYVLV